MRLFGLCNDHAMCSDRAEDVHRADANRLCQKKKLSIHYCADLETIQTVFRTVTSVNQFSLYGAVAEICEENEFFHERTVKPVVAGQSSSSFVPNVIKTNVP